MSSKRLSNLIAEARRRGLIAVLSIYIVGAWIVLQVSATLFPGWNISSEAIRYIWIGAVLMFPIAMVFGWRYDLTLQGIQKTPNGISEPESQPLSKTDFGVLSMLGLATIAVLFVVVRETVQLQVNSDWPDITRIPVNSIAVLPFVNMSDEESNEYFSDGVTEQLLNELARIPELHVAARTSSFYYKGKNEAMQKMGEELGVRTLLEGSVRKSGDRIRITAQLINASDGFHLWSETYDRELDDVFAVQDEISVAIVNTLRLKLLGQDRVRMEMRISNSQEAYDFFLRATEVRSKFGDDSLDESNELLQRAITIDDEFAYAYDALAYGFLLKRFDGSYTIDEAVEAANPLLEKALELRPDLEEAHASLGLLKAMLKRYDESDQHYETALAINPNYFGGQVNYGLSLVFQSRLKEASAAYIRAQALDPLNANLSFNLGSLMMLLGEPDSGFPFIERALELSPDMARPAGAITHWLGNYGRLDEAVIHGNQLLDDLPEFDRNIRELSEAYLLLGMQAEAQELLSTALENDPENLLLRDAQLSMALLTGDFPTYIEVVDQRFRELDVNLGDALNEANRKRAYQHAVSSLIQGNNQNAADYFYWAAGEEEGIQAKSYDDMRSLKMLAFAYRQLDRVDESDALLRQCLDLVTGARDSGWSTPSLFFRLAEIYAIAGDAENAAINLDIAFAKGWRNLAQVEYGVLWRSVQDEPAINAIKVKVLDDLDVQRKRLADKLQAFNIPPRSQMWAAQSSLSGFF